MTSNKVETAVNVVTETFVDMNAGSKIAGLSPVYFRRQIEKLEEERGTSLKREIFGKQVVEIEIAKEIKIAVEIAKTERDQKSQEKKNAKETAKTNSGPTLLDLKFYAKKAGLKIGRLNKDELVILLGENKVEVEGFESDDVDEEEEVQ